MTMSLDLPAARSRPGRLALTHLLEAARDQLLDLRELVGGEQRRRGGEALPDEAA